MTGFKSPLFLRTEQMSVAMFPGGAAMLGKLAGSWSKSGEPQVRYGGGTSRIETQTRTVPVCG
jgi:hypothetical protein